VSNILGLQKITTVETV